LTEEWNSRSLCYL